MYKIFDLTQSGDNVAYTIASDWEDFFAASGAGEDYIVEKNEDENGERLGLNAITVNGTTKYINITKANVADFAEAALSYAAAKTANETVTGTGEDKTVAGLALGYYLVYPRGAGDILGANGSICSLTSTTPTATVNIKATYPTIEKKVDDTNPEIGQTVTYTITGQVPDTTGYETYTYKVEDTMSAGLTFNKNVTVAIDMNNSGSIDEDDLTVTPKTPDYNTIENGFVVNIDVQNLQEYVGKNIIITYTATVNKNAVVGSAGNNNNAVLIYSNDPSNSESKTTNPPVEEKVYTAKLVIDKVDGTDEDTKLAGAKFVLKNEEGKFYKYDEENNVVSWVDTQATATEVTTDTSGAASFNGLEDGTYYLIETEAPSGYNKLAENVEVTISYEKDTTNAGQTTQVKNNSGSTLPSTGGIGTTIFYVVGGVLVVGAGVLLITRKRMSVEK